MKLRSRWGSFSPGIGPPKHDILNLFFIFIFKYEFGAPPQKQWTKSDEFSLLTGVMLAQV